MRWILFVDGLVENWNPLVFRTNIIDEKWIDQPVVDRTHKQTNKKLGK